MTAGRNCSCVVARGGTYLVDEEWTINPNVWYDVNEGLTSDGHNRIVAPAGSGEQIFLNHNSNCWSSQGTRVSKSGLGGGGKDTWVRAYVACRRDMSAWLAVEVANTETDDVGGLRCINMRVLSHEETLFEWRTPWDSAFSNPTASLEAAYDAEAHRLYFSWTGGETWMYIDPPGSASDFGRYAGWGCYGHEDEDYVFDSPVVSMFGPSVSNGCASDCGSLEHDNQCDPFTEAFGPLYEEPEMAEGACDREHGWITDYVGASDPWTILGDNTARYIAANPASACEATARRRIRVTDCTNTIVITITTNGHHSGTWDPADGPLAVGRFAPTGWMGGAVQEVEVNDEFTIETLTITDVPIGDADVSMLVSRVNPLSCNGVSQARIDVSLTGAVWMEAPP